MSEQLPAPEFDTNHYARPNQNWMCGHAREGNPCPLGPDARGRCRATADCKPVLETKPGETKGRWRCTRAGGACEPGPLPDGSCCRPIHKCAPEPTLRLLRRRFTLAVVAVSCALLLVVLGNSRWRSSFVSPGQISQPHSGAAFMAVAATNHLKQSCGACHVAGNTGPNGMLHAALHAKPGIFKLRQLALAKPAEPTAIDESCLRCHTGRNFHQPDAAPISCSFCHAEHQGTKMAATTDQNCDFCHADAAKMAASRTTPVIHHFSDDHPQFRFLVENWRDPDTLKFNHQLHLTGTTIPELPGGGKLDCAFCHRPDAAGAFMKPVAFEKDCRACHSLQFDPETPQLQLPHGSAEFLSAYLRSLPKQYLDLAVRLNVTDQNDFVQQKLAGLRTQFGSGEELARRIFFSTATFGPEANVGTLIGTTRAIFPGCAYCHEVKAVSGTPHVTPPVQTERWLAQAQFNHAKHAGISCEKCHDAVHSRDTADILLPAREICANCHSPRGGVASACAECHTYHKPQLVTR
jgi:hypothetical protein